MNAVSAIYIALCYLSAAVFFGGLLMALWKYASTPSPLNIAVTPHPKSASGVIFKNIRILSTFEPLFFANRWTWVGGYLLHLILLFVILRHLRYFVEPLGGFLSLIQPLGVIAGLAMPLPVIYLWIMRKSVDRLNYITRTADIFALLLLLLIALSGITLRLVYHPDVASVKEFMMGLIALRPVELPSNPVFILHLTFVIILGFYFPFSKLLHTRGAFFSPTRTQIENVREVRYVNPWGKQ